MDAHGTSCALQPYVEGFQVAAIESEVSEIAIFVLTTRSSWLDCRAWKA